MSFRLRSSFAAVLLVASVFGTCCTNVLADPVTYQLTVRNDWSQSHHKPGAPPFEDVIQPHFSHLGGGTHNSDLVVWEVGGFSSPGMIKMQETGWIDEPRTSGNLGDEFDTYLANGTAGSFLNYPIPNPWFPAGTDTILQFEIEESHSLVTLVSMLGPSPDWFIGVSGLELHDGNLWKELVEVDLYPYDGGSRSRDDAFALFGPTENPQKPITPITDTDDTLLLGSIPIGKFTFELLTPQTPPHDLNGDGYVDGVDLGILLGNFNTNSDPAGGELNGTDPVNGLDLGILLGAWNPPAPVAAATVPEPASAGMLSVAILMISVGSRARFSNH